MRKKTKKTKGKDKDTKLAKGKKLTASSCDKTQKIIALTIKGDHSSY